MPEMVEIAFNKWWRSLESSTILEVRYPHEHHGNAVKIHEIMKKNKNIKTNT